MNAAQMLSLATLALQVVALAVALAIGRAPGWRRARILALLAGSAGLYSLFSLIAWLNPGNAAVTVATSNANLVVAAVHVSGWLWFSYSELPGAWRTLPAWVRALATVNVGVAVLTVGAGLAHDPAAVSTISIGSLGYSVDRVKLGPAGVVASAVILVTLVVSLVRQSHLARRGVAGARAVVVGFALFALCGIEEVAVSAGWLDFMFLAEVGYLALVVPVTAQFLRRFVDDAHRLEELTAELSVDVRAATEERDEARQALEVQRRFASLGRVAGGIGHEINNPLQILALNLEEIGERHLRAAPPEAREALAEAVAAADRISRVVAAVRAYAQPLALAPEPILLRDVVDAAIPRARAEFRAAPSIKVSHDAAPAVIADPERLAQLVAAAVGNAAKVLAVRGAAAEIHVRTRGDGDREAIIEIADNGPGFPARVLERQHDFIARTREAAGASGLGLFVARSIVEALGGVLELGRSDLGGGLFRVRLPAAGAPQITAVASISTSAPGSISPAT